MADYIAPYILRSEYACPCCGKLPVDIVTHREIHDSLFVPFSIIREEWAKPINVTSGYRCVRHNLEIGGKDISAHLFGLALDMAFRTSGEVYEMDDLIEDTYPDLRRGTYPAKKFIHIDVGYLVIPRPTPDYEKGVRWGD